MKERELDRGVESETPDVKGMKSTPSMEEVGEATKYFEKQVNYSTKQGAHPSWRKEEQIALSILSHVKSHGLAMDVGEIRDIVADIQIKQLDLRIRAYDIANSLVAKQKELLDKGAI